MKQHFQITPAVYVFLRDGENVLLLKRKNTGYEDGNYGLVAGHLDGGESASDALIREAMEEAGIEISKSDLDFVHVMHRILDDGERIDMFFEAHKWTGDIKNMEPHKCEELKWFLINKLPANTIAHVRSAIDKYQERKFYSEFVG